MASLIPKSEFIGIESVAHLATGGEAPVLRSHLDAASRFLLDKGVGMPGRERMFGVVERAKAGLARLLGTTTSEIAFLANASEGLFVAASGIDWRAGDNVVVERAEFPSVLHVWGSLRGRDVEVRQVGASPSPSPDEVTAAIDRRTRVVAVSHVSYLTGARHDLAAMRQAADAVGARLFVDASHSLGVVPVSASLCDVVVSCAYKWLLGVHGVGVFYVNGERWPDLAPPWVGWHSIIPEPDWRRRAGYSLKGTAERFELGNLGFISVYMLENALSVLSQLSVERIEPHVMELADCLSRGLAALGLPLLTPEARSRRAGNVAFASDRSAELEARLRTAGVMAWAGDGRLRFSVHAYNDEADVARALAALADIVR